MVLRGAVVAVWVSRVVAAGCACAGTLGLFAGVACSASGRAQDGSADAGGSGGGGQGDEAGAGGGFGDGATGGDDGGASGVVLLYTHTDGTLYSMDPAALTKPATKIGDFDCVGSSGSNSMTDLAVSKDKKLYGVSQVAVYPLDLPASGVGDVHCSATWKLPQKSSFYGLTFAPENTVAQSEVLIAANGDGQLFRIDDQTGVSTQVGTLGKDPSSGSPWSLSGDIVIMANAGNPIGFATVRSCPGGNCNGTDTLIEIDVSKIHAGTQSTFKTVRGDVVKGSWCTNAASPATFGSMYGIAAYEDKVFGFSRKGDIVEIDNSDGTACLIASSSSLAWAGAGVTTLAPVKAPPPK